MPRLADGMEQGTIVKWLVEDGATIAAGTELLEIETDKATVTHHAETDGTVALLAQEGETVPVGGVVARIGGGRATAEREAGSVPPAANAPRRRAATPLARRIAGVHDLSLESVPGTGPRGRITKADVLTAIKPPAGEPVANGGRTVRPTRLQEVVAARMADVAATVPQFQVEVEVAFDAALAWRQELKAVSDAESAPSVNDLIVRACALALPGHPLVNGSFADAGFTLHDFVHVGIAVAVEDGLLVVTVRDADRKSIGTIASESRALAAKARTGTATPAELTGATFTVSNLGMFGVSAITPVINPPQAAILGVGCTRPTLARADGEIVDRQMLTLRMTCDHRIINGADASRFLADVKDKLERPMRLAL